MHWLVEEVPGSPEQNMAVDAALLANLAESGDASGDNGQATIRMYRWDQPAVSIGRLQREEPVRQLYPHLPIVRRPTGGRAVLHGGDLTVSVAARLEWLPGDSRSILASHQAIMDSVKAALEAAGVSVGYGGCFIGSQAAVINCFELSAACDLVESDTGIKLVGSAQRREGSALLQQMSLPLSAIHDQKVFLTKLRNAFQQTFANY